MRLAPRVLVVLLAASGLVACEGDSGGTADSGVADADVSSGDVAADTAPDALPDTALDTGADTAPDTAIDILADTAPDAPLDTVPDLLADSADSADDAADVAEVTWCPGFIAPSGTLCGDQDDCDPNEFCRYPGEQVCGICFSAERQCELAPDDCPAGQVCEEYTPPCSCGDGPSSFCLPSCVDDPTVCGDEQPCGDDGHCVPLDCTMFGVGCPASATCDPGAPGADHLGCVRRVCVVDADCDCGACVLQRCYDGPGTCSLPVP